MQFTLKKIITTAVILLVIVSLFRWWPGGGTVSYGPGIMAPADPLQENISNGAGFLFNNYTLTPLAEFEVHARVLSRRDYRRGSEADLSPVDLALGWGRMSDEEVYNRIRIRQHNRFYFWRVKEFPIPRREIETRSANMHMIPSNAEIEKRLKQVRHGDIVTFNGKLVRAEGPGGWRWVSSLTRTDTGNGSCELVFVESFEIVRLN